MFERRRNGRFDLFFYENANFRRSNSCDTRSESMAVAERVTAAQKINRKMATDGARTRCVRSRTHVHKKVANASETHPDCVVTRKCTNFSARASNTRHRYVRRYIYGRVHADDAYGILVT